MRLIRAAGRIAVEADYRDGQIDIIDIDLGGGKSYKRGQADPPPADIVVSAREPQSLTPPRPIAWAKWDGRAVSGSADPDGMMGFASGEDITVGWDEWVEYGKVPSSPPSARQLPLWRGDELPGRPAGERMLAVRDASGATFADAMEAWVRNLRENIAAFEAIDLDDFTRCESCETLLAKRDATEAWGDFYCDGHRPAFCEGCNEPVPEDEEHCDDSGYTYCADCYEERTRNVLSEVTEKFYGEHPDLERIDALQKAKDEEEMEPEAYVAIFGDLSWRSAYGGEAWARIAETWRDLRDAVDREDWPNMHLLVDHAFDLVHNTGSLFTKAKEDIRSWLFQALEDKYFLDPLQYRGKLSPDARKVLDTYIRYSGGVAKWQENIEGTKDGMSKFERALLKDRDGRMAERLWKVHRLSPQMFRDRDSFLEVAFWSTEMTQSAVHTGRAVHEFLRDPDRRTAAAALAALRPSECQSGTAHPAGDTLRREFLPKLLEVVGADPVLRRELGRSGDGEEELRESERALGLSGKPWWWGEWAKFLAGEARRRKEDSVAVASALAAAFIRLALRTADFYDFYALSVVNCDVLPDDMARMCAGLKKVTTLDVAGDLLRILARAVVREARHVDGQLSLD